MARVILPYLMWTPGDVRFPAPHGYLAQCYTKLGQRDPDLKRAAGKSEVN